MSSVHTRTGSSALQCSLTLPGRRIATSLHTSDKSVATQRANALQELVNALDPKLESRQTKLLSLVEDIFVAFKVPVPWDKSTTAVPVSMAAEAYLARRSTKIVQSSYDFLKTTLEAFCASVQNRAIDKLVGADLQRWYDAQVKSVAISTANHRWGAVRALFSYATKMGMLRLNPALGVEIEEIEETIKEAMPDADFLKLAHWIGENGDHDWLKLIYIARYTGLRLMDAVSLRWENVGKDYIVCQTRKSDKEVVIPIMPELAPALVNHMGFMPCDYLLPHLAYKPGSVLSNQFADLMDLAGVDAKETVVKNGRKQRAVTFHSLRAAFISDLARRGVPEDLRMLIVGHAQASTHRAYVKQEPGDVVRRMAEYV